MRVSQTSPQKTPQNPNPNLERKPTAHFSISRKNLVQSHGAKVTVNKHGGKVVVSATSLGVMHQKEGPGRPTHFQAFPDGTLIETVRDPAKPETFRLLICRCQTAIVADQFEYGGTLYLPGMIDPGLAKNLRLPNGIGLYRQPRELLAEMFATLHQYVELP